MGIGAAYAEQAARRADSQYDSLRYALDVIGQRAGWQIKQTNLIGGTLGSVLVNACEEALEDLGVKKKAWTTIRKEHVRR